MAVESEVWSEWGQERAFARAERERAKCPPDEASRGRYEWDLSTGHRLQEQEEWGEPHRDGSRARAGRSFGWSEPAAVARRPSSVLEHGRISCLVTPGDERCVPGILIWRI